MSFQINIRPARLDDQNVIMDITERTAFFRPMEIAIAREVFIDAAENKPGNTYQSYIAEADGKIAGWVCFGATPCTMGTFDIYWIAVEPSLQRQGIGRELLNFAHEQIEQQHGRLMVVETSSLSRYKSTQIFYEKNGYTLAGRIADFYAPGDDKLVYLKHCDTIRSGKNRRM